MQFFIQLVHHQAEMEQSTIRKTETHRLKGVGQRTNEKIAEVKWEYMNTEEKLDTIKMSL